MAEQEKVYNDDIPLNYEGMVECVCCGKSFKYPEKYGCDCYSGCSDIGCHNGEPCDGSC